MNTPRSEFQVELRIRQFIRISATWLNKLGLVQVPNRSKFERRTPRKNHSEVNSQIAHLTIWHEWLEFGKLKHKWTLLGWSIALNTTEFLYNCNDIITVRDFKHSFVQSSSQTDMFSFRDFSQRDQLSQNGCIITWANGELNLVSDHSHICNATKTQVHS